MITNYLKHLEFIQKGLMKQNTMITRKIYAVKNAAHICQEDGCFEGVDVEGTDFCKKHRQEAMAVLEDREDPFESLKPRMGAGRVG